MSIKALVELLFLNNPELKYLRISAHEQAVS